MEFIIVYCVLEGPFIYYAKPQFKYETFENIDFSGYVGATKYIGTYYGTLITLFGLVIALSRMRDKIVRTKVINMWYHATCRRNKMVKFDEFEKIVEQS